MANFTSSYVTVYCFEVSRLATYKLEYKQEITGTRRCLAQYSWLDARTSGMLT